MVARNYRMSFRIVWYGAAYDELIRRQRELAYPGRRLAPGTWIRLDPLVDQLSFMRRPRLARSMTIEKRCRLGSRNDGE